MTDQVSEREEAKKGEFVEVTLGINDQPVQTKSVTAGKTTVAALRKELGVDAAMVLYLVHGNERKTLDDADPIHVKAGMHFEAIGGGGVS
jgi:hypothetical protein